MFEQLLDNTEASTRFKIVQYLIASILIVVLAVLILSSWGVAIPEFVSGVVLMGYFNILRDAAASYYKSREEIQTAKIETVKAAVAAKEPCAAPIPVVEK